MNRIITLAAAGLLLALNTSGASAGETLSQSQLRSLFPGSFTAVVHGMVTLKFTAKGNGELIGRMESKQDSGRWSLNNGKLCIMLTQWTSGKSSCSAVVADNGWYRGKGVKFKKV